MQRPHLAVSATCNEPETRRSAPNFRKRRKVSCVTFTSQFQERFEHASDDLQLAIRMSIAANTLRHSMMDRAVAKAVGYRPVTVLLHLRRYEYGLGTGAGRWVAPSIGRTSKGSYIP